MIRKIHYVWFGGNPIPNNVKSCIDSWKKFAPGWEIIQWDENNFDIDEYRWVKEAIENKSYAHAADFVRLYVLVKYGGLYVDTDVQLMRNIEGIITNPIVLGIENHIANTSELKSVSEDGFVNGDKTKRCYSFCLQAGIMYSEPNQDYFVSFMNKYYNDGNRCFVDSNGMLNKFTIDPVLFIHLTQWGAIYRDETQELKDGIILYNSSVLATRKTKTSDSYAIHWFDQSWNDAGGFLMKIKKSIKKHLYFLYRLQW